MKVVFPFDATLDIAPANSIPVCPVDGIAQRVPPLLLIPDVPNPANPPTPWFLFFSINYDHLLTSYRFFPRSNDFVGWFFIIILCSWIRSWATLFLSIIRPQTWNLRSQLIDQHLRSLQPLSKLCIQFFSFLFLSIILQKPLTNTTK